MSKSNKVYVPELKVYQPRVFPPNAEQSDWFVDSDGQHWIRQQSGQFVNGYEWLWATYSGPGNGRNLTDSYNELIASGVDNTMSASSVETEKITIELSSGPIGDGGVDDKTKKWPNDAVQSSTDYVFFQFGKFVPPFSKEAQEGINANEVNNVKRASYDSSANRMKVDDNFATIMLPIPQDLGNEVQQGWQGKAFTGLGRAAISSMAGGDFNILKQKTGDFTGNLKAIQDSLTGGLLNMLPGVGGNLDVSDISGATRGVVLNPNAELLYDGPEMRELGMSFKMVPKNPAEAKTIRDIVQTFRKASLPRFGGAEGDVGKLGSIGKLKRGEKGEDNFIRVPRLCKFTFMHGSKPHEWINQFKPCAISNVTVNYTPDGTFATYSDGSPVATELRLNFQETKLIFADEVQMQGASF